MQEPNPPSRSDIDFRSLWNVLLRNRLLVAGGLAAGMATALLITLLLPEIYHSDTTIRIDGEKPGLNIVGAMIPAGLGAIPGIGGSQSIHTDIALLKSRRIAEAVVDSLRLQVELLEPEVARERILRVIDAPRVERGGTYRLDRQADGSYTARRESDRDSTLLPERVVAGQPFRIGAVTLALEPQMADPPDRIRIGIVGFRGAVGQVREYMAVVRPDPSADVLSIRYRTTDPGMAAAVPNTAALSFIEYKNRVSRSESRSTVDFLEEQAATYGASLQAAEGRLRQFREQAQIIEPTVQASEQIRQLAQLQAERDALQVEQRSLRRLLTEIDAAPGDPTGPSPYRQLASFPSLLTNGMVQDILRSLIELETDRADLLVRRTAENRDVAALSGRIADLEGQLYRLARNYLEGVDSRIEALEGVLGRSSAQLARIPAAEVEFLRLAREQKLLEEIHTLIQTKLKEAEIQAASEPARVQVVDPALVPTDPSSPRPMLNLAIGMLLGLVGGVALALGRGYLDPRVHSRQDIWIATQGLPVLAAIPPIPLTNGRASGARRLLPGGRSPVAEGPLLVREEPGGEVAEAYRRLRAHLTVAGLEVPHVLVVTSPSGPAGGPSTAANLAMALAQQGLATLLVDADLRNGRVGSLLQLPQTPGLTEVLRGQMPMQDAVQTIHAGSFAAPLSVLPSGSQPPNPSELLSSPAARELIDALRKRYAVVVIHAPPLDRVTDGALLGAAADETILTVRSGLTDRRDLRLATMQLRALGVAVRGVVITDADPDVLVPLYDGPSAPELGSIGNGASGHS